MKKLVYIFTTLLVCLTSCQLANLGNTVTGQSFELLVVGEERVWRDSVGLKLAELLKEDMPGLAQSEQFFTVSFVRTEEFSGIFKPVRNILFYDIDAKKYTQGKINYTRDVWANTQAVARITAPDIEEFEKTYNENIDVIRNFFMNAEFDRAYEFFAKHRNIAFTDTVKAKFGANLIIPSHLTLDKYGKNFCWFSNGNINLRQDIIVYSIPYTSKEDLTEERILAVRDSFLKKYVPGPTEGSYMTTEYRYIPPISQAVRSKDNKYSMEVRGLWRVEGDMMGGPFVSRTYIDKENKNLVTAEAFIYSPNQRKRTPYRQLEALISNVTWN